MLRFLGVLIREACGVVEYISGRAVPRQLLLESGDSGWHTGKDIDNALPRHTAYIV